MAAAAATAESAARQRGLRPDSSAAGEASRPGPRAPAPRAGKRRKCGKAASDATSASLPLCGGTIQRFFLAFFFRFSSIFKWTLFVLPKNRLSLVKFVLIALLRYACSAVAPGGCGVRTDWRLPSFMQRERRTAGENINLHFSLFQMGKSPLSGMELREGTDGQPCRPALFFIADAGRAHAHVSKHCKVRPANLRGERRRR